MKSGLVISNQRKVVRDYIINKSISSPIRIIYHKASWDSIISSLYNQLAILQDHISNLSNSKNPDPIKINNAANILKDTIVDIYSHLPEKPSNETLEFHSTFNSLNKTEKLKEYS